MEKKSENIDTRCGFYDAVLAEQRKSDLSQKDAYAEVEKRYYKRYKRNRYVNYEAFYFVNYRALVRSLQQKSVEAGFRDQMYKLFELHEKNELTTPELVEMAHNIHLKYS